MVLNRTLIQLFVDVLLSTVIIQQNSHQSCSGKNYLLKSWNIDVHSQVDKFKSSKQKYRCLNLCVSAGKGFGFLLYISIIESFGTYFRYRFLCRAWIKDLSEDGQCEVFFIDWGNISKQSRDNLSVIKDIHWTMRPQIVLFRISTLLLCYYLANCEHCCSRLTFIFYVRWSCHSILMQFLTFLFRWYRSPVTKYEGYP